MLVARVSTHLEENFESISILDLDVELIVLDVGLDVVLGIRHVGLWLAV